MAIIAPLRDIGKWQALAMELQDCTREMERNGYPAAVSSVVHDHEKHPDTKHIPTMQLILDYLEERMSCPAEKLEALDAEFDASFKERLLSGKPHGPSLPKEAIQEVVDRIVQHDHKNWQRQFDQKITPERAKSRAAYDQRISAQIAKIANG